MTGISVLIEGGRVTINMPEATSDASVGSKRSLTLASLSSASDDDDEARARSSSVSSSSSTDSDESQDLGSDQHDKKRAKLTDDAPEKPKNERCNTCQMRDIECKYELDGEGGMLPCQACDDLETECIRFGDGGGHLEEWETKGEKLQHRLKVIVSELEDTRDGIDTLRTSLYTLKKSDKTVSNNIGQIDFDLDNLKDTVKQKGEAISKLETKVNSLETSFDKRVKDIKFDFDKRIETISKEQGKIVATEVEKRVQQIKVEFDKRIETIEKEQNKLVALGPRRASRVLSSSKPVTGTASPQNIAAPNTTTASKSNGFAPAMTYSPTVYDYGFDYDRTYGFGSSNSAKGSSSASTKASEPSTSKDGH